MRRWMYLLFLFCLPAYAESELSGRVVDRLQNRPLAGANVRLENSYRGLVTDREGRFSFTRLQPGEYTLVVSFIGYEPERRLVTVASDSSQELTFALSPVLLNYSDVMVTSTKADRQLRDVAMPIAVVRAEQIDRLAPVSVTNALQSEPGLSLGRDGIWGTTPNVRGLARNHVVALVDGNRIDTANDLAAGLSMIDVNDIERIEVIKGAASSLYGSGAMGGVINIITKDGWYQDQPYVQFGLVGGFASVNQSGLGKLSITAGSRRWHLYASGMLRKADDARTPAGYLNSQYQDKSAIARLGWRPGQKSELLFNYQRYHAEDVGMPGGYPIFPVNADVRYPKEDRSLYSVEYQIRDLSAHCLKTVIKYFYQDILRDVENIPHLVNQIPASGGQPARRVSVLKISPGALHKTHGVQMQSNWHWGPSHHFIAGVDVWQKKYEGYRSRESKIEVLNPTTGAVQKTTNKTVGDLPLPDAYYRSMGLFSQYEWSPQRSKWQVTLGGRYDLIQVENEMGLNPLYEITDGVRNDAPAGQSVLWQAEKASDRSWSANFGLLYRLLPAVDLTANFARSFRSPYLEERYQYIDSGNLVKVSDPELDPENGHFFDAGVRLFSGSLQAAANVFYNRLLNMIAEIPGTYEGRNALLKTNIGKAALTGGEVSTTVVPWEKISVRLHASYVHGQDLRQDHPLSQIPPLHGGVTVQWQASGAGTLELAASAYDRQTRVAAGELTTDGYVYYDLYFNSRPVRIGGVSGRLMLGIENVTDKAYRNHLATNRGLIVVEPGRNFLARYQMEL